MNREPISKAVGRRLNEVRERVNGLDPERFGEGGFFLTSVKEVLRDHAADARSRLSPFSQDQNWAASDTDCLTSLRVLSLHGQKTMPSAPHPPVEQFLKQLKASITARQAMFDLLADRYAWPLNFSFHGEDEVRETLLMRLMTTDRARIETGSVTGVHTDDLLLQLNLIAVHACATTDLRFLDALNYYYELLPATLYPESQNAWLLASCFALYARALNSWL
jgi:hypothetical protein